MIFTCAYEVAPLLVYQWAVAKITVLPFRVNIACQTATKGELFYRMSIIWLTITQETQKLRIFCKNLDFISGIFPDVCVIWWLEIDF
jgi:hypothetical protein